MSYTRDKDRATRHQGAIAAADNVNPRAARARERARQRQLAHRDRDLAGMTYGARGGLGAISRTMIPGAGGGGLRSLIQNSPGGIEGGGVRPRTTGDPMIPTSPIRPRPRIPEPPRPPITRPPRQGQLRPSTPATGATPKPPPRPVLPPSSDPRDPLPQAPVVTGGGGGSSGGGSTLPPLEFEEVEIPDFEEESPSAPSGTAKRNIIIGIAVLGGAYLLLRNRNT